MPPSRIDCIIIAYGLTDDLLRVFRLANAPNIMFHLFLHSQIPAVIDTCQEIVRTYPNLYWYAYGNNRGLATSWNEGIHAAYRDGADVALLINDDMIPAEGDAQKVATLAIEQPDLALVNCRGFDLRSMTHTSTHFGLTAITRRGWAEIGCFDERITPIYWEDIDWARRLSLAGLPTGYVDTTATIHAGSKTSVTVAGMIEETTRWYTRNEQYYRSKWGRIHTEGELYTTPFNDPALGLYIPYEQRDNPYPEHQP